MVTPVLEAVPAGTTQMSAYFPKGGKWVSMKDYSVMIEGQNKDEMINIPMGSDTVNVWLKPGHMVIQQPNNNYMTTDDVLANAETNLVFNRDLDGHAGGKLFID